MMNEVKAAGSEALRPGSAVQDKRLLEMLFRPRRDFPETLNRKKSAVEDLVCKQLAPTPMAWPHAVSL